MKALCSYGVRPQVGHRSFASNIRDLSVGHLSAYGGRTKPVTSVFEDADEFI